MSAIIAVVPAPVCASSARGDAVGEGVDPAGERVARPEDAPVGEVADGLEEAMGAGFALVGVEVGEGLVVTVAEIRGGCAVVAEGVGDALVVEVGAGEGAPTVDAEEAVVDAEGVEPLAEIGVDEGPGVGVSLGVESLGVGDDVGRGGVGTSGAGVPGVVVAGVVGSGVGVVDGDGVTSGVGV